MSVCVHSKVVVRNMLRARPNRRIAVEEIRICSECGILLKTSPSKVGVEDFARTECSDPLGSED